MPVDVDPDQPSVWTVAVPGKSNRAGACVKARKTRTERRGELQHSREWPCLLPLPRFDSAAINEHEYARRIVNAFQSATQRKAVHSSIAPDPTYKVTFATIREICIEAIRGPLTEEVQIDAVGNRRV